jgi:hypothetical protein
MLDETYIAAIRDASSLLEEINKLDPNGERSDKEIAKLISKKRLVDIYSRLSSIPVGSKTGAQLLRVIRDYENSYRRTESLSRGLFP